MKKMMMAAILFVLASTASYGFTSEPEFDRREGGHQIGNG